MANIIKNTLQQLLLSLLVVLLAAGTKTTAFQTVASNATAPKQLDLADLDKWESIPGNGTLSNDGRWVFYPVRRNSRELELRLHDVRTDKPQVFKEASSSRFSGDSKWLGFIVMPDAKAQDALRKDKKPIPRKLGLLDLATTEPIYIEGIDSFEFSADGAFLSMKKTGAADAKTSNVIVRELKSGKDYAFGNVKDYRWSDNGSLLAIATELTDNLGNSVTLFDGKTQSTRLIDTAKAAYNGLTWRRDSTDLAVFRSFEDKAFEGTGNEVLVWRDLAGAVRNAEVFAQAKHSSFPKDSRVAEKAGFRWSADGKSIFFSTETWKKKAAKPEKADAADAKAKESAPKAEDIPALEIWNTSDVLTITEQKADTSDKNNLAVWHLEPNKFVQLEDEDIRLRFQLDTPILLATDARPYDFNGMFGRPSFDIYSVDINTGARAKVLTNIPASLGSAVSPGGKYFVYLKDDQLNLYDFATSKSVNLTKDLDDSFVNLEDDHPVVQKPPYGMAGWDATGTYFLAYSKFDVWRFDAKTGKATRLTNGKPGNVQNRFERFDTSERFYDLTKRSFVRNYGLLDKTSTYSIFQNGTMTPLYKGDGFATFPVKAKDADTIAVKVEGFNDSPDLFVGTAGKTDWKQVSNINPFEKEYKSGKAELISYTNANGQKLQGSLYYPDDFVPGQKYPMITYIYELLTDSHNRHALPSTTNYYNRRVFTSQGYFVFMPDIVFDAGDPGISSVKTLEIAVKAVVAKGDVDEKRVGLVGHSWGGYQAAFAVTGTNIFAAAVAGAGISNLITMYGTITPSFSGQFESKHFEVSQERMMVPPWKDIPGYLRNSAIPNISKMQTPLLMEVGDADKNVNWGQGHEMYNAARREKKPMVLLVYANEGHGLTERKNQMDYQRRILDWFSHYLKKEPAKRWIKENIAYKEQQELLKKTELE